MPLIRSAPDWVNVVITVILAGAWVGAFLAFKPSSASEVAIFLFSPIALTLLIVTVRKASVGPWIDK